MFVPYTASQGSHWLPVELPGHPRAAKLMFKASKMLVRGSKLVLAQPPPEKPCKYSIYVVFVPCAVSQGSYWFPTQVPGHPRAAKLMFKASKMLVRGFKLVLGQTGNPHRYQMYAMLVPQPASLGRYWLPMDLSRRPRTPKLIFEASKTIVRDLELVPGQPIYPLQTMLSS